jgi:hypothetical protein
MDQMSKIMIVKVEAKALKKVKITVTVKAGVIAKVKKVVKAEVGAEVRVR